jgi:hypothetical protein
MAAAAAAVEAKGKQHAGLLFEHLLQFALSNAQMHFALRGGW